MMFSASYDRFAKIVSAFVCLGLLAAIAFSESIVMFILGLVAVFISFAYSPRGYIVDGRSILVRRLAGNTRIALDDVREVRRTTPEDSRGCIRLRGSGGLFGYYGLFRSDALGKFSAYMTSRQNNVVVTAGLKTAVFSPDDVDGFLAAIRAVAPVSASSVAPAFDATRPDRSRRFGPLLIALAARV